MASSHDILRDIAHSGANLTIDYPASYDLLRDLAGIAKQSGCHLTLSASMSYDFIRELLTIAPNNLTFVDSK